MSINTLPYALTAWLKKQDTNVIIGILGLFIAFFSTLSSCKQYEAASLQAKAAALALSPQFELKIKSAQDQSGYLSHRVLEIHNLGGQAYNIGSRAITWFEVKGKKTLKNTTITLRDYFNTSFDTGATKGVIATYFGLDSNKLFNDFYTWSLDDQEFHLSQVCTLVRIQYEDPIDGPHSAFYESTGSNFVLIQNSDGVAKWKNLSALTETSNMSIQHFKSRADTMAEIRRIVRHSESQ